MKILFEYVVKNIRNELKHYIQNWQLKTLVIGVSGGLDSAACCALASSVCDELNVKLIGRSLPIESNKDDEIRRARKIGERFCTNFREIDLTFLYHAECKAFETLEMLGLSKIAKGNLKARMRMKYLYMIAGESNGIVLSTDNFTEYLLGFWTLHGDVGDYGMIQKIWKTEVYNLTHYLSLTMDCEYLLDCIEAIPTDGLGITNSDLDQIMPGWEKEFKTCREAYEEVDNILREYLKLKSFTEKSNSKKHLVIQRHLKSQFKRENPYNIPRNKVFSE